VAFHRGECITGPCAAPDEGRDGNISGSRRKEGKHLKIRAVRRGGRNPCALKIAMKRHAMIWRVATVGSGKKGGGTRKGKGQEGNSSKKKQGRGGNVGRARSRLGKLTGKRPGRDEKTNEKADRKAGEDFTRKTRRQGQNFALRVENKWLKCEKLQGGDGGG